MDLQYLWNPLHIVNKCVHNRSAKCHWMIYGYPQTILYNIVKIQYNVFPRDRIFLTKNHSKFIVLDTSLCIIKRLKTNFIGYSIFWRFFFPVRRFRDCSTFPRDCVVNKRERQGNCNISKAIIETKIDPVYYYYLKIVEKNETE